MEKKINFQKLMSEFANDISKRTGLLTEDSVRYYVFKAFLSQDSNLNNYTLELPYESITYDKKGNKYGVRLIKNDGLEKKNGKLDQELDLYHSNDGEPICMEIKFHRHPSDINFPMPQAAGSLFNDLRRLQLFSSTDGRKIRKLFLYVTDSLMDKYLKAGGNGYREALKDFYSIKAWECFDFSELENKTFKLASFESISKSNERKENNTFKSASSKSFIDKSTWGIPLKLKLLWGNTDEIFCNSESIREVAEKRPVNIRLYEVL